MRQRWIFKESNAFVKPFGHGVDPFKASGRMLIELLFHQPHLGVRQNMFGIGNAVARNSDSLKKAVSKLSGSGHDGAFIRDVRMHCLTDSYLSHHF